MPRLTWLAFLFAAVLATAVAEVQSGRAHSGGQPIPGASVTAECGGDRITTITDLDGRFEIGGLPATSCKFSVAIFGFEPAVREAAVSSSALTFELQLQSHATLPAQSAPVESAP